ncbi:MAG: HAD-IA family hydrolase [Elusimicrobiota bacterium]|jgi:phosphoglycolate phosphatase
MIEIDALIFDLDGTLIDSAADLIDSVRTFQQRHGLPPGSESLITSFVGDGVVALVQRAVPGLHGEKLRQGVDYFKRYYRRHCLDKTRLYPGVKDVLGHFRDKKLAVITNKPMRATQHILEGLGILSRFQVVLGGDSLPTKKPDPEPIRYALMKMHVRDSHRAVVVGDSINDILAGRRAGCCTCGVISCFGNPDQMRQAKPDKVVLNTLELMRIFN